MFLIFSNYFNVLMSKIIFKKLKNIIDIYFNTKNYLKSNYIYPQPNKRVCQAYVQGNASHSWIN